MAHLSKGWVLLEELVDNQRVRKLKRIQQANTQSAHELHKKSQPGTIKHDEKGQVPKETDIVGCVNFKRAFFDPLT